MNKKWFTLIELMIVIAVFSIWVMAILRLVLVNMNFMDNISTKTSATFLAKEWIELVYNIRDSNRLSSLPWGCLVNEKYLENSAENMSVCVWDLFTWSNVFRNLWINLPWKIYSKKNTYSDSFDVLYDSSRLYLNSGAEIGGMWYSHDVKGIPTEFSRYVLITGVVENWIILPMDRIVKVESHVLYKKWTKKWEIILESFIWNY